MSPLANSYREVYDGFARIRDLISRGNYCKTTIPASCVI